jgi:hypothetical protein
VLNYYVVFNFWVRYVRPLTISERTKISQGEQILTRSLYRRQYTIDEAVSIRGIRRVLDAAGMILLKT